MSSYHLLKELIPYLEDFQTRRGDHDLPAFIQFLNRAAAKSTPEATVDFTIRENQFPERFEEVEFSVLLTNLYRFGRHYVKKALTGSGVKTLEEFGFLASLLRTPGVLKSELIQQQLLEISSGTEVLKRLIKMEYIRDEVDPGDGRARRLFLTERGRNTIIQAFDQMYQASRVIRGNLSDDELRSALRVMEKLSDFHREIHDADRATALEELVEKYVTTER